MKSGFALMSLFKSSSISSEFAALKVVVRVYFSILLSKFSSSLQVDCGTSRSSRLITS